MSVTDPDPSIAQHAAHETPVCLEIDGRVVAVWLCTPHRLEDLAAGWLFSEAIVATAADILAMEVQPEADRVRVCLADRARAALLERNGDRLVGPAPTAVDPDSVPEGSPRTTPELLALLEDRELLVALFSQMFDGAALRAAGGGVHTGGWVESGTLMQVVEDVGRHNVVDKLVGWGLRRRRRPEEAALLLSGRISGPAAAKGCRSRVAAMITISIPTTLACDLARRSGMILVGRARGTRPQIHWP
jgi:FdhD protein